MRDATAAFLAFLRDEHARCSHETDPQRLAERLGIRVVHGRGNHASAGPPAVIVLGPDAYLARRRFTLHHEIAHVLMQRAGLEQAIEEEVDQEDADVHVEAVANYGGGVLLLPDPLVNRTVRRYGETARAVLELSKLSGSSLAVALRRYVHLDEDASRAAFVMSGSYVADVAAHNYLLPFWRYDRLPEPHISVENLSMAPVAGSRRRIGVLTT